MNMLPPLPPIDDSARRWTREIATLRSRAIKAGLDKALDSRIADVLRDALVACDSLLQDLNAAHHEHARAAKQVRAADGDWNYFFERLPCACVCTDANGFILKANPAAASLLSISPRHLDARLLTHFAEDREQFVRFLRSVVWEGAEAQGTLTIRPRDRARVVVEMRAVRRTAEDSNTVLWFFQRTGTLVVRSAKRRATFPASTLTSSPFPPPSTETP